MTRTEGASASADFGFPVKMQARGGGEWIANDQVTQAVAIIDSGRGGGDSDRGKGNDGDSDRGRGNDARPDPKPDKGGKADRDDRPDRVKGSPAPPPSTPIVSPSALQPSGDGKGKGKGGGRG